MYHLKVRGFFYVYVYLVTGLNGIRDNITKTQRQKSSTKFYNSINQNTVIGNNIKKCKFLLESKKIIPKITNEE